MVEPNIPKTAQDGPKSTLLGRRSLQWLVVLAICLLFLMVTNPRSVPSLALIVGFVAIGGVLLSIVQLVFHLTGLRHRLSSRQRRSVVLISVVLPVLLLMMQSIGQLTVRDVITLGGLFVIGVFYFNRVRR